MVCVLIHTGNISWCPLSWRSCRLPARGTAILLMWREISVSAAPWPLSLCLSLSFLLSLAPSLTQPLTCQVRTREDDTETDEPKVLKKAALLLFFNNPENKTTSVNLQKRWGTVCCVDPFLSPNASWQYQTCHISGAGCPLGPLNLPAADRITLNSLCLWLLQKLRR